MFNSNYDIKQIERECQSIIEAFKKKYPMKSELQLHFQKGGQDEGGYNEDEKSITLYEEAIVKSARENDWSVRDTFLVVLAHEMGHVQDRYIGRKREICNILLSQYKKVFTDCLNRKNLEKEDWDFLSILIIAYKQLVTDMEMFAYHHGKDFLPPGLETIYEESNRINLRRYLKVNEEYDRVDKMVRSIEKDPSKNMSELHEEFKQHLKKINELRGW
jgi:hypothetical protein